MIQMHRLPSRRVLGASFLLVIGSLILLQDSFKESLVSRGLQAGLKADLNVVRPTVEQLETKISNGDGESTFSAVNATIAIATATTSRHISSRPIDTMPLVELMLPSLPGTVETDRYQYKLYVAIDTDDEFWMDPDHQQHVRDLALETSNVEAIFVEVPPEEGRQRVPFNEACRKAYDDGADYIVRINDDTEFISKYWASVGIAKLLSFSPPNFGVVGPTCKQGHQGIMTHDMTHRTHMEVFSLDYYPVGFGNIYLDNWISGVYGGSRTAKLDNWYVYHHVRFTRYKLEDKVGYLHEMEYKSKKVIEKWLESREHRL